MVKNYDDMLSRLHLVPERNGQTDRQTDLLYQYFNCYISMLTRDNDTRYTLIMLCRRVCHCSFIARQHIDARY